MFKFIALMTVLACVAGGLVDAAHILSSDEKIEKKLFAPFCNMAADYKEHEVIMNKSEVPEDIMSLVLLSGEAADSGIVWYIDHIKDSINLMKKQMRQEETLELLDKSCDAVRKYEAPLRDLFEAEKAKIVVKRPEVARVTFENVPCTTLRRVLKAKEICQTAKSSQKPMDEVLMSLFN